MATGCQMDAVTSTLMQKIDCELMCGICLQLFKSPLLLPCGHNFCEECVSSLVHNMDSRSFSVISVGPPTSFHCPVCQEAVPIKNNSITHLPVNRALESIVNLYKECSPVGIFDGPLLNDIELTASICSSHGLSEDMYCGSCNIIVCSACVQLKHSGEKAKHVVEPLKQCVLSYQAEVSDIITDLKKKMISLTDRINLLEEMISGISLNEEHLMKHLGESVSSLQATLRGHHDELKRQLVNQTIETKRPVKEELDKCRSMRLAVTEVMKSLASIKKVKEAALKLQLLKDTGIQLNNLLHSEITWCLQSSNIPEVETVSMSLDVQPHINAIKQLSWQHTLDLVKVKTSDVGTQTAEMLTVPDLVPTNLPSAEKQQRESMPLDGNEKMPDVKKQSLKLNQCLNPNSGANTTRVDNGRYSFPLESGQKSPSLSLTSAMSSYVPGGKTPDSSSKKTPSKSIHAEALATFVARRRTISPSASAPAELPGLGMSETGNESLSKGATGSGTDQKTKNSSLREDIRDTNTTESEKRVHGNATKEDLGLAANLDEKITPQKSNSYKNDRSLGSPVDHTNSPHKTFSKHPLSISLDFDLGPLEESSKSNKEKGKVARKIVTDL